MIDQEERVVCVKKTNCPFITPEITPLIKRQTEISLQSCNRVQATNHLPADRTCHRYCSTTACGNNMAIPATLRSGIVDSNSHVEPEGRSTTDNAQLHLINSVDR